MMTYRILYQLLNIQIYEVADRRVASDRNALYFFFQKMLDIL